MQQHGANVYTKRLKQEDITTYGDIRTELVHCPVQPLVLCLQ